MRVKDAAVMSYGREKGIIMTGSICICTSNGLSKTWRAVANNPLRAWSRPRGDYIPHPHPSTANCVFDVSRAIHESSPSQDLCTASE